MKKKLYKLLSNIDDEWQLIIVIILAFIANYFLNLYIPAP